MKRFQITLLMFLSLILTSCQELSNNILNYRIERAFHYIENILSKEIDSQLNLPSIIPFDREISVTYSTSSPESIDFSGKTFQTIIKQSSLLSVSIEVKNTIYTRDFNISISPVKNLFKNNIKISVLHVGQGDAILIELPNDEVILIDAGDGFYGTKDNSWSIIYSYLNNKGITHIDYLVGTHNHNDHSKHIPDVLNSFTVGKIYSSYDFDYDYWSKLLSPLSLNHLTSVIYPNQGDYIIDTPGLYVRVVANLRWARGNPSSMMIWIKYLNFSIFFAADGDIENAEKSIIDSNYYIESQVLKIGHHGINDSTGSEFLSRVNPDYGILTTLRAYTHFTHSNEAIIRLRSAGVNLVETSRNNHIIIKSDGLNYEIFAIDNLSNQTEIIVYNYDQ